MKKIMKIILLALSLIGAVCALVACGSEEENAPTPHRHILSHYVERASTCYAKGTEDHWKCLGCGKLFADGEAKLEVSEEDIEIDLLPHTETIDLEEHATCFENGKTEGTHCMICHAIVIEQEVIPAGHTEVVDKSVVPTCTADGLTEGKHCSVCNTVFVKQTVVPATGHTEVIDQAVAATCTKNGKTEGKHCSVCNTVFVEQEVIPATGQHIWNTANACDTCGTLWNYTAGLEYELNGDENAYSVSGIGTASGNIVIPNFYEGKPVTAIRADAFASCRTITSIIVSENVTEIGESAFYGCVNLTDISISRGVAKIGRYAFFACYDLRSITVENGNTAYCSKGGCLIETATKTLIVGGENSVIPADGSVETIARNAFMRHELNDLTIPDGVKFIESNAFQHCIITNLTISGSVTEIKYTSGDTAFNSCYNLQSIMVEKENAAYSSVGNCLIEKETKRLILTCENSVMPSDGSIAVIGSFAFLNRKNLTSIVIPYGVKIIDQYAFLGCDNLVSVKIPNSIERLETWSFDACRNLKSITFEGTKEEWKAIKKGFSWDDGSGDYTVYCSDGDLDKDGNEIESE